MKTETAMFQRLFFKFRVSILLFASLMCLSTGCASARKVVINTPWVTTEKQLFTNRFEFGLALQGQFGDKVKSINEEQVVAWSLKINRYTFPPEASEEAIVIVTWVDQVDLEHRSLLYCKSQGEESSRRAWRAWPTSAQPPIAYGAAKPLPKEIAAFIQHSNFGYNEKTPRDLVEVVRVISYCRDRDVVESLRGVSDFEKGIRWNASMEKW
jgi:hypothetical protein